MENFFKIERLRLGMTQTEVAELCDVSKKTIINWEKENPIPSDKLNLLAVAKFDVQYIVTGVRSKNLNEVSEKSASSTEPDFRETIELLTQLESVKSSLEQVIRMTRRKMDSTVSNSKIQ